MAKNGVNAGLSGLSKGQPSPKQKPDYTEGDRVRHVKFGDGTVRLLEDTPRDYKVTVEFDEAGQKVMYAAFADRKSTRLNSSHIATSRMPSSA